MSARHPRCWPPLRAVLLALYLVQAIASGPMIARMSVGRPASTGQRIVICTPDGLKTIDWPGLPGEKVPKRDTCYCPCGLFCGSCTKLPAAYGIASPYLYPAARGQWVHSSALQMPAGSSIDLSAGSSRSPPSSSIS